MNRFLLFAAAAALISTTAQAQPGPGRERPNFDRDSDGKVTLAEFKAARAERQDRMFARLDADKDGKVTQAEADAAHKQAESMGRKGRGHGPGGMVMRFDGDKDGAVTRAELSAGAERQFQAMDANKDGWLSKEELLTMRQKMRGGPGPR
ncbi:EF-hand domain-containing protein [Phenylobacterium kunshanense]|uniref:EF-hand domain-containing protein n=1 Tax=Phenylobacterium kunshanense TaxID=1445034 RepID=A0A328BHT2_9CAUL|nr:EF-hand domain-containing protein [Phenylobacterium kunshanense]RAK65464.1 EF-hand domain-containing protein [Phenylobacterium kunshanense]